MKKFNTSFNGYNKNEVNNFVMEVTSSYEELLNKLKVADNEIENLRESLKKYKDLEATLNRAIVVANDTARTLRKTTQDEAQNIINDARKNASRIVNDALQKAERAEADAKELQRRIEVYKRRVTYIIDEQKQMIESIGDDIEF